jgi:peptide/nickel transport system permease protein
VTVANAPRVLRLARGAALEVCQLDFVLVARARGERAGYTLVCEVLPSVMPVLLVDFGVRFSGSVVLVAGLSFLGLGVQQPQADWGLIISENREALTFRPLTVIPSVIAIALLTIGVNLMIDGRRRRGR